MDFPWERELPLLMRIAVIVGATIGTAAGLIFGFSAAFIPCFLLPLLIMAALPWLRMRRFALSQRLDGDWRRQQQGLVEASQVLMIALTGVDLLVWYSLVSLARNNIFLVIIAFAFACLLVVFTTRAISRLWERFILDHNEPSL